MSLDNTIPRDPEGQVFKAQSRRPLSEKKELLQFYVFKRQHEFRDAINDLKLQSEESYDEAIKLFNDPFYDEKLFDSGELLEKLADGENQKIRKAKVKPPLKSLKLITGSYEKDVLCLMDADMVDELVEGPKYLTEKLKHVLATQFKDATPQEKVTVKFQIYMMLSQDRSNQQNVLHYACILGSKMIPFLLEQAKRLQILDILLFQKDMQGRSPLYRLCQQGYLKRGNIDLRDRQEHAQRYIYVKSLVENPFYQKEGIDEKESKYHLTSEAGLIDSKVLEQIKQNKRYLQYWFDQVPQIEYQPLHWLAFWNDYKSIDFLLKTIDQSEVKQNLKNILRKDKDGFTALDFAGMHGSFETIIIFINYLKHHFKIIQELFNQKQKKTKGFLCFAKKTQNLEDYTKDDPFNLESGKGDQDGQNQEIASDDKDQNNEHPWVITKVSRKELTPVQQDIACTYYWAAFIGDTEYCKLFLKKLGVSPFMQLFQKRNLVSACIMGNQYKCLKLIVENSKLELLNPDNTKYIINDKKQAMTFVKSRCNSDNCGNNSCHLAFEMNKSKYRYKFLSLLLQEEIGDLYKPNIIGLQPFQVEHNQPIRDVPRDILSLMPTTIQEIQEADYLIVCPEQKKDIILDQLEDLKLYDPVNHKQNCVHQFPFQNDKYNLLNLVKCKGIKKVIEKQDLVAIAISVPLDQLDKLAEEMQLQASLTETQLTNLVQAPFKKCHSTQFYSFSATEQQKLIVDGLLSKQIDFEELVDNEVIIDHFPLHKRKTIFKIQESFDRKYKKLKQGFLCGGWQKHMQPINMIRQYYGEEYAFEYAFLIHYQAWLQIPCFFGIIITIYQLSKYMQYGDFQQAIDTPFNFLFGFLVTFWATLMVESWRYKQRVIQYLWACSEEQLSKVDERTEQFKYYYFYNPITNLVEKFGKQMPKNLKQFYKFCTYLLLTIIIAAMVIHSYMKQKVKLEIDADGNLTKEYTKEEVEDLQQQGLIINTSFSVFILIVGKLYEILAVYRTDAENYRFNREHTNTLVNRLFRFDIFNFYFPMMYIGFDQSNHHRLRDIFNLMLTQMAFKQIASNVVEYLQPIILSKRKLLSHYEDFGGVLKLYDDSQIDNLTLKKSLNKIKPKIQFSSHKSKNSIGTFEMNESMKPITHQMSSEQELKNDDIMSSFSQLLKHRENSDYGNGGKIVKDALSCQVYRDLCMMSDNPKVLLYYEELTKQFGYIVLFSGIFPLAAFLSIISNGIQVGSQITNLQYLRRFRAKPSNGIGTWIDNLESLCILGMILNCYATYFTSKVYENMFVLDKVATVNPHDTQAIEKALEQEKQVALKDQDHTGVKYWLDWTDFNFFVFIVITEHAILLLKFLLRRYFEIVPAQVSKGQLNNKAILEDFHDHSLNICKIIEKKSIIKQCKTNVLNMLTEQVFKMVDENNKTIEYQNNYLQPKNKENIASDSSSEDENQIQQPKPNQFITTEDMINTRLGFNSSSSKDQLMPNLKPDAGTQAIEETNGDGREHNSTSKSNLPSLPPINRESNEREQLEVENVE